MVTFSEIRFSPLCYFWFIYGYIFLNFSMFSHTFPNPKHIELIKLLVYYVICLLLTDVDPGPQDPCVVAEMKQIHRDYRVLWRKRDGMATLSREEHLNPCLDRLLLFFWAHYIEDGPHLLCTGSALGGYRKQRRGCCYYIKGEGYLQM